jgi:FkbM family methyltransferase
MVAAKANPRSQVHCFELFPENLGLMEHFIGINGLANLGSHQLAISEVSGATTFYVPRCKGNRLPDIGSVKNRFESGRFADLEFDTLEVTTMTLDEFCGTQGVEHVDLIKFDVEECELQVLRGAWQLLERSKPDIICEVVFGNAQNPRIEQLLGPLGYQYYVMEENGLRKVDGLDSYTGDGRQTSKGGYSDRLLTTRPEHELAQLLNWGSTGQTQSVSNSGPSDSAAAARIARRAG